MKSFLWILTATAVCFLCAVSVVALGARPVPNKPAFSERKIERKIDWKTPPIKPGF